MAQSLNEWYCVTAGVARYRSLPVLLCFKGTLILQYLFKLHSSRLKQYLGSLQAFFYVCD